MAINKGETGEGRSMRSRAIWCPVQLKELSHTWVRGTHSPFTVPARSLPSNLPKNIFYFSRVEYLSHVSLSPKCPQHPPNRVQHLSTFHSAPPNCCNAPFLPTDAVWSSTQATCHNPHDNILGPLSPTTLKERILPQLRPFLLHHLPDF